MPARSHARGFAKKAFMFGIQNHFFQTMAIGFDLSAPNCGWLAWSSAFPIPITALLCAAHLPWNLLLYNSISRLIFIRTAKCKLLAVGRRQWWHNRLGTYTVVPCRNLSLRHYHSRQTIFHKRAFYIIIRNIPLFKGHSHLRQFCVVFLEVS